ncbi:MAG: TonB-dependent receptor, partial [bacterium]|nr:TonB-dependent receptor [bacterium]
VGGKDKLIFLYSFTGQNVDSFQFVTGQNPDTDIKNHNARLSWNRAWSGSTVSDVSLGFDRLGTLLLPASGALGPIMTSRALATLGPPPPIPVDRIQNRYRVAAQIRHVRGHHALTAGFALARLQYNGEETDAHRGIVSFGNDFGRDAITNLRMGTPRTFTQALGTTYRGYRNWSGSFYLGDQWRATPNLSLNFGLSFEPFTRPTDVTGRSDLPFSSDLNNWGPRFGFALRLPGRWGTLRGAYSLLYGEIYPVTYGHERLNPP